jgi:hypothetical protein
VSFSTSPASEDVVGEEEPMFALRWRRERAAMRHLDSLRWHDQIRFGGSARDASRDLPAREPAGQTPRDLLALSRPNTALDDPAQLCVVAMAARSQARSRRESGVAPTKFCRSLLTSAAW